MKRLLKPLVVLVLFAAMAVGGVTWWKRTHKPTGPKFETTRAERGRVVARVTATGTLSALVTVQVGAQVSGRIAGLYVDFNSPVKKGQVIARIDPQLYRAAVEQARANLVAAQGNLTRAKAQALDAQRQGARAKALRAQNLIAQADADTADANAQASAAQVAAAVGAVEQAKASLHQAQVNLNYTTIVSPIDGVVISRNVDVGQTVAATLQAPVLFTIAEDLRKMQVDTNVAEADVGRLQPGGAAMFTVDAYPGERFKGTIRQIRNAPQTVQNVVTYDAVIDVPNGDLRLKPGMTANVTFVYAEKDDVLKVANAALRFRPPPEMMPKPDGGGSGGGFGGGKPGGREERSPDRRTLWVLAAGAQQPRPVPVRTGVSDGTTTEIVEGDVKEGDLLVTEVTGGLPSKNPRAAAMRRGF